MAARTLAREVRARCLSAPQMSHREGRRLAEACLNSGLQSFSPAMVCSVIDGFSRHGFLHKQLLDESMKRVHRGILATASPAILSAWVSVLSSLRVSVSPEHLDDCLYALGRNMSKRRALPLTASAPLLRSLLLMEIPSAPSSSSSSSSSTGPRQGAGFVGQVLSQAISTRSPLQSSKGALADVAWILEERPPSWLQTPLAAHHEATLQLARRWPGNSAKASPLSPDDFNVKSSVAEALKRLGCEPQSSDISEGHLCLPTLRLALLCLGRRDEIQDITTDGEPFGGGDRPILRPLVEVRQAQLRQHLRGWQVEVIRHSEWSMKGEERASQTEESIQAQQELLLRRRLAGALQAQVPQRRQQHF
eukprot:TRINITY_DN4658_c0_g1_i6.p1 TRINITY_DN4658_c0_g1~~TRINITY_DN4658_c0_g1_i6.p1  ORF type:complete len:376 (-),score=41.75 TRINITY_DN4658_c0_g1_i6:184-1272(-)